MKKLGVLLAALFLIAVGALGGYLYAEKKAEEKFKTKVERTLAEAGLKGRVKVGGYSVSLIKKEASLENVRVEPGVKDYGDFLVELKVIKKISFLDYKEDPELKVPTSLKAAFEGIELFIKDKKKGAELPLKLSGLLSYSYSPRKGFLSASFTLNGNLFDFETSLALAGVEPSLLEGFKELSDSRPSPFDPSFALFMSRLLQVKPLRLELLYYDRGFYRRSGELLFGPQGFERGVKELEKMVREEENPCLKTLLSSLLRAAKEGRGGFKVELVNTGGLSLQDFGILTATAGTPEGLVKLLAGKVKIRVTSL